MSATELERGVGEILIDEETLQGRIRDLGHELSADYAGRELLLVGVLKGAVFFMADLMRSLTVPCEIDFMAISSYGASTDSSGVVRILKDLDINIEGRHVLVVEDIIDSGLTLSYLIRNLESREPASLEVCALMTKPDRREIDVPGVVHPLLTVWREETVAYCRAEGLGFRVDASNADTKRGLIRERILPLLRELHPAADENLLRALDGRETMPPALAELLASPTGSKRVDLGGGVQAVREHERLWLERGPVELAGEVRWGEWTIRSELAGLKVRGWRPGDRLAGRSKKIQDLFVDAKIPRSEREAWPLVVRGDEVVAVPGIVDAPGIEAAREVTG